MTKMRKLYEKAIAAKATVETYEEFSSRVEWNARQFIGTDGGTMEEYIERQIKYYDKVISRQEEAKAYKEDARKMDRKEMVKAMRAAAMEKNAAKVLAYQEVLKEARKENEMNDQPASSATEIGLTGPVYDDDEKPSYFF